MTKRSFFERLSGSSPVESFDSFDEDLPVASSSTQIEPTRRGGGEMTRPVNAPEPTKGDAGQLPVDVHQTPNEIIVRAFVAGVRPDELNISISRDMVEIEGTRSEREQVAGPDYFSRELFWGSFSRTILLPQEIDVDASSAAAKDGLLTIIMPKLDKARQTKLRVKAG